MSKRLQVILQDPEYRAIQRAASSAHLSLAEWVRRALEFARRHEPEGNSNRKLEAIRLAAQHEYPTADIDQMLEEVETGYRSNTLP
ncbi:MAG TPA: hypothetical protein VF783_19185 [Terriglobales bacterium]